MPDAVTAGSSVVRRGEYKTPGGKLVAATVSLARAAGADAVSHVGIDGDFLFVDGGDDAVDDRGVVAIAAVEQALEDVRLPLDVTRLHRRLSSVMSDGADGRSAFVGCDAWGVIVAFARAVGDSEAEHVALRAIRGRDMAGRTASGPSADPAGWSRRWESLRPLCPLVVAAEPLSPVVQMALDEVLARAVADGDLPPVLRFWEWTAPAVVIGAYQSVANEVDEAEAARRGFTVVRRVTGGGAMFVVPDHVITYSLVVPAWFADGLKPGEESRLCDRWAVAALRAIGVRAGFESLNDIADGHGGKIGGAAERRFPPHGASGPGSLLHHTMMAYDIDAGAMTRVLRVSREKLSDKGVASARKRVRPLRAQLSLTRDEVVGHMVRFAYRAIPGAVTGGIPSRLMDAARSLAEAKFATRDWLYRLP